MPGNVAGAVPSGVLPQVLCSAFSESRQFPMLAAGYHDGTTERSLIVDGVNGASSLRTWKLNAMLTAVQEAALIAFFESHEGGLIPFYFYNPVEAAPGSPFGSNWDGSGGAVTGRHTMAFRGGWSETTGMPITAAGIEMVEIA
jgi:hypothetical protein